MLADVGSRFRWVGISGSRNGSRYILETRGEYSCEAGSEATYQHGNWRGMSKMNKEGQASTRRSRRLGKRVQHCSSCCARKKAIEKVEALDTPEELALVSERKAIGRRVEWNGRAMRRWVEKSEELHTERCCAVRDQFEQLVG